MLVRNMKVIRVFPRRTKATPTDDMAFIGGPPLPLFLPEADEVHVSVTCTYDLAEGERLRQAWEAYYPGKVRIGGPALDDRGEGFTPGMYLRPGYTITSRGCPNHCGFCLVPEREGRIRELRPIAIGNDVLDNNLLACSDEHISHVLAMLAARPKAARFSGGLEAARCVPEMIDRLRSVRISELFLAYDFPSHWRITREAIERFRAAGLRQRQVRCYVLAGFGEDSPEEAEERCRQVMEAGGLPFLMLYQAADRFIDYGREWKLAQRKWTRPAAMLAKPRCAAAAERPGKEA